MPGAGIGDFLANLRYGNPDQRIAQALDTQPLPGGAPGGAPPNPAATGAGGAGQQPLPQAQVYQADPVTGGMASLLMQAHQRDRTANAIDRNTAGIVAGFSPAGERSAILGSVQPQDDTVGVADQIVGLQKQKFQNEQAGKFASGVSLMLQQKYGMSKEQADGIAANPQVAGQFIEPTDVQKNIADWEKSARASGMSEADIAAQKAIMLGAAAMPGLDPVQKDMNHDLMAWRANKDNAGKSPPSYLTNVEEYKLHVQGETQKTKEVTATQGNFQPALQAYDKQISELNEFLDPKNREVDPATGMAPLDELTGWYNKTLKPTYQLSERAKRLQTVYTTLMAGQFASAVQDFPGSRISTKELLTDAPSKSTMDLGQSTGDLVKATEQYRDQLLDHRANLFGKAQQLDDPNLSDAEHDKYVNQIYKAGGDLGPKAVSRAPPVEIKSPADALNLPAGRAFVPPDGTKGYAVHDVSDVARLPHGAKYVVPDGSGRIGVAP